MRSCELMNCANHERRNAACAGDECAHAPMFQTCGEDGVRGRQNDCRQPRDAGQTGKSIREREQNLAQPFVRNQFFAGQCVRKYIGEWDLLIIQNPFANRQMPADVAVAVEHLRHKQQTHPQRQSEHENRDGRHQPFELGKDVRLAQTPSPSSCVLCLPAFFQSRMSH